MRWFTASYFQVKLSYIHGIYFILPPAHISKVLVSKSSPVTPGQKKQAESCQYFLNLFLIGTESHSVLV